jgi:uncharacterized protein YndB with AHSA1/START domain
MTVNGSPDQGAAPARVVRVERVIPADAATIFDVLADPRQHRDIDGSGSVKNISGTPPERLALGSRFGMSMKVGVPYLIHNEVVEFEEGRRIAWRHYGHHVWRYTLEPVPGGTRVTEEFDWRSSRIPWVLELIRAPEKNAVAMERTLERLEDHVAPRGT